VVLLSSCRQASVEGDVEGVEGALPPVAPPLPPAAGGIEAHEREVEALEGGLLGGEVAAGVHGAPQPGVDRLDRYLELSRQPGL
jgi:hypothetical protein